MKRSLEMPVAEKARRGRTYGWDRIYRTPVGSAGGKKGLGPTLRIYLIVCNNNRKRQLSGKKILRDVIPLCYISMVLTTFIFIFA